MSNRNAVIAFFVLLLISFNSQAQNRFYHVYVDNDANPATGCDIDLPEFATSIEGVQSRLTITTDGALPPNIISTNLHQCDGVTFDGGSAVTSAALGLNSGVGGSDVFEAAVAINDLNILSSGNVFFYYATESDTASDIVLTNINGGPIFLGFVFPVPALGLLALTALLLILWFSVKTQLSRNITMSIVLLSTTTFVWAMSIIIDGQTNDWNGINPANSDPIGDTSSTGSFADLTAVFLTKSDNQVFFRMDVVDVENQAPIANDINSTTSEDNAITLTVTGSDAEGSPLTFTVDTNPSNGLLSGFTIIDNTSSSIQYTPDPDANGPDSFTFVANDGQVNSAPATASIAITEVNDMPSFTSGGDVTADENSGAFNNAWATAIMAGPPNENTQVLTFNTVSVTNAGLFSIPPTVDAATGNLSFTPTTDVFGTSTVTINLMDDGLTANGGIDTSADITFDIIIEEVNDPPVLANIADPTVDELTLLAFTATATDANIPAQNLTFTLGGTVPVGAAITPGGDFTWTPTEAQGTTGTFTFDVIVTDDGTNPDDLSDSQTINVTVNKVNTAPVLTPVGSQTIDEATNFNFNASATDTDLPAQNLTFSLSGAVPTGAAISSTGVFNWTPSEAQGPGTYTFDVVVTDDGVNPANLSDSETITLTVTDVNTAPVLNSIGNTTMDEQTLLSFIASAVDSDAPVQGLTFSLAGTVPTGAAISTAGNFTWTPTEIQGPGSYTFDVVVTDDGTNPNNLSDSETITITVNEVNAPPVANAQMVTTDDATALVITLTGSDSEGSPLTFSINTGPATGSLGTITQLTPTSASVTYTPGTAGNNDFTFIANDGLLNSMPATVSLNVTISNLPPVANDDAYDVTGNVGLNVPAGAGVTANDTDPDLDTLNVSAFDNTSAQGGSVNVNTNGSFTYVPPVGYTGADSFAYTMTDGGFSDSATVNLTVSDRIWFIDNSAPGAGNGTLNTPFNTLAGFDAVNGNAGIANPAAGECVFMDETGNGNYIGPVTLLANQTMVGKASSTSVAALCGITLAPNSTALPSINGAAPTITSANIGINLATGNTLRGLNVGDTTDTDINATTNVGILTIDEMSLLGTGRALNLTGGGTLSAAFDQLNSTSGVNGVNLAEVDGVLTVANGTTIGSSSSNGIFILNLAPGSIYDFGNTNVTNSGANGIQIYADNGANVTFNQLNISNPSNFAFFQFGGGLNISSGVLNAPNSTGFSLENAVANVNLTSVTSVHNNSTGIKLAGNTGTIDLGNGSLSTNNAGTGFDVGSGLNNSGGAANINYNGSITSTGGSSRSVSIQELAGGSVTLNGSITDSSNGISIQGINNGVAAAVNFNGNVTANTGTNIAINLGGAVGNSNGTINFAGTLDIDTTTAIGLFAVAGGRVNITSASNTATATTGHAIFMVDSLVGSSGISFNNVSTNGTGANSGGIYLKNTGSLGSFNVNGGLIQNLTGGDLAADTISANGYGIGVYLENVQNINLNGLTVSDSQNFGIRGFGIAGTNNFTNLTINGAHGSNSGSDEAAVTLNNATGTLNVTGGNYGGGHEDTFSIFNSSGTLTASFSSVTLNTNSTTTGDNALQVISNGTATTNLNVNNSTITGARSVMVFADIGGTGGGTVNIGSTSGNNISQNQVGLPGGGSIEVLASGNGNASSVTANISNNTILAGSNTFLGDVLVTGTGFAYSGTLNLTIENNTIGLLNTNGSAVDPALSQGDSGIVISQNGNGVLNGLINGNNVFDYNGSGIEVIFDAEGFAPNGGDINLTITNNTVSDNPGSAGAQAAIFVLGGDNVDACIDIRNNELNDPTNEEIELDIFETGGSGTYRVPGLVTLSETGIEAYYTSNNTLIAPGLVNAFPFTGYSISGGAAGCQLP